MYTERESTQDFQPYNKLIQPFSCMQEYEPRALSNFVQRWDICRNYLININLLPLRTQLCYLKRLLCFAKPPAKRCHIHVDVLQHDNTQLCKDCSICGVLTFVCVLFFFMSRYRNHAQKLSNDCKKILLQMNPHKNGDNIIMHYVHVARSRNRTRKNPSHLT